MIKVITVEREYGSGGGLIAQALAERLRWTLWDQRLTDAIARSMNCRQEEVQCREERRDPLRYRLLKSFMRGSFEGNPNAPTMRILDADRIVEISCRLIHQAADAGKCVIVGRGGACCLRERRDAFHVFVYASADERVRRLRENGKSAAEARESVKSVDEERAAFIKKYFHLQWPELSSYHLMINSQIGDEAAVKTILAAVSVFEKRRGASGHAGARR
jgi:cytidylate kinase-like protein